MKRRLKERFPHEVWSYIIITLGLGIFTLGWSFFLLPAHIVDGGVTGISAIIYFATNERIPVGVSNLVINAVFIVLGFKLLGSKFGAKTIYGIVLTSLYFMLWQQVLHFDQLFDVNELGPFVCALLGGSISGVGIGIAFTVGGNSGGTDIIALIINKYYNISPGRVLLYIDIVIIGCSYFVFHKLENVLYGYVIMVTFTYVLDLMIDGSKRSYQITVFSKYAKEIGDAVMENTERGASLLHGEGCYSGEPQKVLMVIAYKNDKPIIMEAIHRIDPHAFVSVSRVEGVFGEGFERMKL